MTLASGARLGPYEVLAPLGAGGMGEVYRARDGRLSREVAIKILPETFAADPERLARFQREAQVLAALNHPHIGAIYGLEESEGRRALILELVEGETLADRIARGRLPVDEALEVARQIADALEAAHERGIVHRDLKPANVKLTPGGKVKVLDFGLAKALTSDRSAPDLTSSPTMTAAATQAGVVIGTAAYMSPEQARGRSVDKRADIWAFGAVLYEMLTGRKAFEGDTISDTLAAVLMREPDWSALPPAVSAAVRRVLRRCLDRDPRTRFHDVADARIEMDEKPSVEGAEVGAPPRSISARRILITALLATLAGLGLGWIARRLVHGNSDRPLPVRVFSLTTPPGASGRMWGAAISPDGSRVAYALGNALYVQSLDRLDAMRVAEGKGGVYKPFWSTDGKWIAFGIGDRLYKVRADSDKPTELGKAPEAFDGSAGGGWLSDGRIAFMTGSGGLLTIPEQGGDFRPLLEMDGGAELDFHDASPLPDGAGVLFVIHRKVAPDTLAVWANGRRREVLRLEGQALSSPVYSPTGHILFARREGTPGIWAVGFDRKRMESRGDPFLVVAGGFRPSVARDGTMVYSSQAAGRLRQLAIVDRAGKLMRRVGQPQEAMQPLPAVSPDGRRIAVVAQAEKGSELWAHDVERGTVTRLTFQATPGSVAPRWSPDGRRVATSVATAEKIEMFLILADGSGSTEPLGSGFMPNFSPDGRRLHFTSLQIVNRSDVEMDLWTMELDGRRERRVFLATPADENTGRVSPDARWIAYASNATGSYEIYVRPSSGGGEPQQVSTGGGDWPQWRSDGRELFYTQDNAVYAATVAAGTELRVGTPTKLFEWQPVGATGRRPEGFDVLGNGQQFVLVMREAGDQAGERFVVVQNWAAWSKPEK